MTENYANLVQELVGKFGNSRTALMDIARALHARTGYITEDAIGCIADALDMHRVEVRDMISFYSFFSREERGRNVIRVCDAVVERMFGADELLAAFEKELGIACGETTADGTITLEKTACIGQSDQPASVLVNDVPLTSLKPEDVSQIVDAIRKGEDLNKLPQAEVDLNLRQPGDIVFAPMERGAAVREAVNMTPEDVIEQMNKARVRGRGGAGFPLAMKWNFCRKAQGGTRYVICNADEGEPGTFKDRVILTQQPDMLFEGMTVAAYALDAKEGYIYLRGEYAYLKDHLEQVLAKRRRLGMLGQNICGREGFDFDIRIQLGAGAYICGEESALIESLEGKRGAPRDRPPFPVQKGYQNEPSSVNNVETLCCAARIMEKGAEWFANYGSGDSKGTKLLSISGDVERPGVYEMEYGITVEKMLETVGAGNAAAVQVGGPSGTCIAPKDFGRTISFEDLPTGGSVIVFGPERDILEQMRRFVEFFVHESCGWCAPCRAGTSIMLKQFEKILDGKGTQADLDQLEEIGNTVKTMSRCGLGQTAANPILTTMRNFPQLYQSKLVQADFVPRFDLNAALKEGSEIAGHTSELLEEQHA